MLSDVILILGLLSLTWGVIWMHWDVVGHRWDAVFCVMFGAGLLGTLSGLALFALNVWS